MARHNDLGKQGEEIAKKFLVNLGYTILETNWRFNKDEIDIIAKDGDDIVMVEVKTRSTDYYGFPEDAVDDKKEKFLIRATESYLLENDIDVDTRFDIVAIVKNKKETKIHHIIDAFYPD